MRIRPPHKVLPYLLVVITSVFTAFSVQAQNQERQLIIDAADAMGGIDQLQSVRNLTLRGYAHEAYQDGGSEITTEPNAPEKVTNLTAYERVIDLGNDRTRVTARMYRAFIFASSAMMQGLPINQVLDGDIAYNPSASGNASRLSEDVALKRRMDLLANPLVAIRAALQDSSELENLRTVGNLTLVDVNLANGAEYTLAMDNATGLPSWNRWIIPHENLGEVTLRAEYSAWQYTEGLQLPMSFNVVSDFHDTVMLRLHIDRYIINGEIDNLAAPAATRNSPAAIPEYLVDAEPVVEGVWHMIGNNGANSILLEFDDHLTLFEVPTNRAWSQAVIDKARLTVPDKPLTEVIISHHHFDHTGGLRVAIAEGLTVISQSGNLDWFQELADRSVVRYPDSLSRNPQPLKVLAVDDHLRLSDDSMTVDIYKLIANSHMVHGIMAYLPQHNLLIQGDLFDLNWEVYFWGNTYADNLAYRDLDVEIDVPIHGRVRPIVEVRRILDEQKENARQLCGQVAEANLSMPGCPLAWDEDAW